MRFLPLQSRACRHPRAERDDRSRILALLLPTMLAVLMPATANAWGVMFANRIVAQAFPESFDETFCTGWLENTPSYSQPLQVWEGFGTSGRHYQVSHEGGVSMGQIRMKATAILDAPVEGTRTPAGVQLGACPGGTEHFSNVTQWEDTITGFATGTYRFTMVMTSQVVGDPIKVSGQPGAGVGHQSGVTTRFGLRFSTVNSTDVLSDTVGDGDQGVQVQTVTHDVDLSPGSTVYLVGRMEMGVLSEAANNTTTWEIDALNTANFYIDPVTPGGSFTTASGHDYSTPEPEPDGDITGVTDISGDAVPDLGVLSQVSGKRPRVRYYSGANRQKFAQVAYLSKAWTGVAAATVADGNQDGVANDPAVAVLAQRIANNRLAVQVRMADGGTSIAHFNVLNNGWTPVDVVVIDDANGDGVTNDTAIGVLGQNLSRTSQKQTTLQVVRLSDGSLLREVYFNNSNWTPLAAGAVPRTGQSPLLAVLAEKKTNQEIRVQTALLSDGSFQSNKTYLSALWRGKDLAILKDTNGDSVLDDASYMVLAVNVETGLNRVQVRRTGGPLVKNVLVMNEQWQGRRIAGSDDISGNLFEELGVLGNRISDGKARLELTDFDTEVITGNIFP